MSKTKKSAYVKLADSAKAAPQAIKTDDLSSDQSMEVTVRIRRKQSIENHLQSGERYSREQYGQMFGAAEEDIKKIEEFAHTHHLTVATIEKAGRSVMLKGKVSDFENAFKVKMSCYQNSDGHTFRGRSGEISIPEELKNIVEGVFGLDDRPHSRPMFQVAKSRRPSNSCSNYIRRPARLLQTPITVCTQRISSLFSAPTKSPLRQLRRQQSHECKRAIGAKFAPSLFVPASR